MRKTLTFTLIVFQTGINQTLFESLYRKLNYEHRIIVKFEEFTIVNNPMTVTYKTWLPIVFLRIGEQKINLTYKTLNTFEPQIHVYVSNCSGTHYCRSQSNSDHTLAMNWTYILSFM
jgi:hypothetical protein